MITKLSYDVPVADRLGLEAQPNRVMQTRVRKWSEKNECSIVSAKCINDERRWEFEIESVKPLAMGGILPQFLTVVDGEKPAPVVVPAVETPIAMPVSVVVDAEPVEVKVEVATTPPAEAPAKLPKKKKRGRPAKNKS